MGNINKGTAESTRLIVGGDVEGPGQFVAPTVFDRVTINTKIARDEIIGPVLGIMHVSSTEEALSIASDIDYG